MWKVRALIVDAEPLARERIRGLLEQGPGVEIVGECSDGREAAEAIRTLLPDLVFLMAGTDGLALLDEGKEDRTPAVILVAARDRREDFRRPGPAGIERLALKSGGRICLLKTDEIDWIEAEGNYTRLHVDKQSHRVRETMSRLEAKLDPSRFLRIHRSTIVNTERVKEIRPLANGGRGVVLKDGTRLISSRAYRGRLKVLTGGEDSSESRETVPRAALRLPVTG